MSKVLRTDLVGVPFSMAGYIAEQIFPTAIVPMEGGTYEYSDYGSAGAASRTIGASVTGDTSDFGSVAYACVQYLAKPVIPWERNANQDPIPVVAGAKRAVAGQIEAAAATVLNALADTNIADDITSGLEIARNDLMGKAAGGQIALVCSASNFAKICADTGINTRAGFVNNANGVSAREALANALAVAIGVDKVLIGNSTSWTGNKVWLVVLPTAGSDAKSEVQLGRNIVKSQGEGLYVVEEVEDTVKRGQRFDTYAQCVIKLFNSELVKTLDIVDLSSDSSDSGE